MEPQVNAQPEPSQEEAAAATTSSAAPKAKHCYIGNPSIMRRRGELDLAEFLDWVTDALDDAKSIRAIGEEENTVMRRLLSDARKLGRDLWRLPNQKWLRESTGLTEGHLSEALKSLKTNKIISMAFRRATKHEPKRLTIELLPPAIWEIPWKTPGRAAELLRILQEYNREHEQSLSLLVPYGPAPEKLPCGGSGDHSKVQKLPSEGSSDYDEDGEPGKSQTALPLDCKGEQSENFPVGEVSPDRSDRDRDRSRIDLTTRLWAFVGEHERTMRSEERFSRFAKLHPQEMAEFLTKGEKLKAKDKIRRTPGAWLNDQISKTGFPGFEAPLKPAASKPQPNYSGGF